MKSSSVFTKMLLIAAIGVMIPSCAINPVTGKKQIMLMSESQELAMGAQYDPEVIATFGEYKNDKLQNFVQAEGTGMGKISHRPKIEYHIKVLDSPVINAFAVPGGYIYLTRGIMAQLNNEAELAGIIGHEMGHICARHSASQQTKQTLGQLLLIGGMIASERFASLANYAYQGMQLLFLKFSRDDEREADRLGVEYSSKISFDAHKMADFFQVLKKMQLSESEGGIPTFLSTHPDPGDRYNAVNTQATRWQDSLKYITWKVNTDSYVHLIDGIVYGEDPRQGYVEWNVFYHPELKFRFTYPSGWQFQNSPIQVQMAPGDGKAMIVFSFASGSTLQEAAQSTIQAMGVTVQESRSVTVNGMNAMAVVCQQVSQDQSAGTQSTIQILSYFIDYNGVYYVFHGLAAATDFNTYFSMLQSTMTSFAQLTDLSKINVQPNYVRVKKVTRAATLAETFKTFGIPSDKYNEYALLNEMELTDKLPVGKLIKIVAK
jgi:predicted Zn-dependent protease